MMSYFLNLIFFFFNDTATTEIYTLSLHDALPIWCGAAAARRGFPPGGCPSMPAWMDRDRKSTRLNSSHSQISYAVFCLKKKKKTTSHSSYQSTIPSYLYTYLPLTVPCHKICTLLH